MNFRQFYAYFLRPAYKSNWKNIGQILSKISRLIREYIRYIILKFMYASTSENNFTVSSMAVGLVFLLTGQSFIKMSNRKGMLKRGYKSVRIDEILRNGFKIIDMEMEIYSNSFDFVTPCILLDQLTLINFKLMIFSFSWKMSWISFASLTKLQRLIRKFIRAKKFPNCN